MKIYLSDLEVACIHGRRLFTKVFGDSCNIDNKSVEKWIDNWGYAFYPIGKWLKIYKRKTFMSPAYPLDLILKTELPIIAQKGWHGNLTYAYLDKKSSYLQRRANKKYAMAFYKQYLFNIIAKYNSNIAYITNLASYYFSIDKIPRTICMGEKELCIRIAGCFKDTDKKLFVVEKETKFNINLVPKILIMNKG